MMNKPQLSILIPHLREPENDKALRVCLDCLIANSDMDYELLIEAVSERRDFYPVVNEMIRHASTDWVVLLNSDMFVAPGWLVPMFALRSPHTIVTNILVECGAIPVSDRNIHRDFGRTVETFRRVDFEHWTDGDTTDPRATIGWFCPSLHHRDTFLEIGGYDTTLGTFPVTPVDWHYWDMWQARGWQVTRALSYTYHLQSYSDLDRPDADRSAGI